MRTPAQLVLIGAIVGIALVVGAVLGLLLLQLTGLALTAGMGR